MRSHVLLLGFLLTTLPAAATDRVVSTSGLYNTITSALEVSVDGDRILVAPGNYQDFVHITISVSILPQIEGGRYSLNSALSFENVSGKTIVISGIEVPGVSLFGSMTARTSISILDSKLYNVALSDPYTYVQLYRDTIVGNTALRSGSIIGCVLTQEQAPPFLYIEGNSSLPDDLLIIGNQIGFEGGGGGVNITPTRRFRFENNYVRCGSIETLTVNSAGGVFGERSLILNNTFRSTGQNATVAVRFTGTHLHRQYDIKNNTTINYPGGLMNYLDIYTANQSNNLYAAPSWINPSTGEPTVSSPLLNAGDPDPRYLDLDLSTNDVGCYGGSNSRANFTTAMGSAVVCFMQAPRVVAQGQPVQISAIGFDR